MRTTRRALPSMAALTLAATLSGACATASRSVDDGLRNDPEIARPTTAERRAMRDSTVAQEVADEVGPRVTVSADFDYAAGSRHVEARFHLYDDAYVIVGHLDAAGRLRVVFPSDPGDDGFVRGGKIYHVPPFFAGFADEYSWRYSEYRLHPTSMASRRDSYDAGLGYVFVIASWRPMRLDRVTNGRNWQTYDIADINYMYDPREAIEEFADLLAGDNREAYTIEYAHYSTTNYGMYSFTDFDAVNSGCYNNFGFRGFPSLSFSPFGFFPSYGFGFGSTGCGSRGYAYGWPYGYAYGGYPGSMPVFTGPPIVRPRLPAPPIGAPVFHQPRIGGVAVHRPEGAGDTPATPTAAITAINTGHGYHRPGLVVEDVADPRGQGRTRETSAQIGAASRRPTIQDMVGGRRIDEGARATGGRDSGIRDNGGWAARQPTWTNHGSASTRPRDEGTTVRRNDGGRSAGNGSRGSPSYSAPRTTSSPRSEPRGEATRSAPRAEPRSEPSHAAPARVEPAARPSPPPQSSPSQKKP